MAYNQQTQAAFEWMTALPWVLFVLVVAPLLVAAVGFRCFPTLRWFYLLGLALGISLVVLIDAQWLLILAICDALIATVGLLDLLFLVTATRQGLTARREMVRTASLGKPLVYAITLENNSGAMVRGAARDDVREHLHAEPLEHPLQLPNRSRVTFQRRLTPQRRGPFELRYAYLRVSSPLGLWQRTLRLPANDRLNVYPDMQQLSEYALLARTNRLSLIGVRQTRRIGQDSDFERLRDYSRDDNYRHIDWRSTARRRKLTVKQFQSDQSQRLIFMLDCGRMMTNERDGFSLLDHALNATLMLAYVALQQGDDVGMLCFSDRIHRYIPPRGGKQQMNRLLQASFDQFPKLVESRYDEAFLYLSNHCKRRSLVVLATNVIDEVNANQIVDYLGNISGRHLPLGVLLRDRQMFNAADNPAGDDLQLYRAAAAAEILCWRNQVISDLSHQGVLVVDTYPEELTAPLVNQYLAIKAQHRL